MKGNRTMANPAEEVTKLPGIKKYFSIGETIAREGDPSEGWFVLLNGRVGVVKHDLTITEFGDPGTVFGEVGCFLKSPRTATIQALEPTSVLYVHMDLDDLVKNHPDVTRKILLALAERLVQTTEAWWVSQKKGTDKG